MPESEDDIIRRYAYQYYLIRKNTGLPGNEKTDWEMAKLARAEHERGKK